MPRITRRELLTGTIVSNLVSCEPGEAPRSLDQRALTILYDAQNLGPEEEMPAKFLLFSPLVAWNRRGELEGRLAERWHMSPDVRTATFRLRPGVHWHDGMPVTAHDMKFTLDLLTHPDTMQYSRGSYTVDVHDDLTYSVTYHHQDIVDDGAVNDWIVCWPRHLLANLDPKQIKAWDFWDHPIGCGPYRVVRSLPRTMIELEVNPDYSPYRGDITQCMDELWLEEAA